MRRKVVLSDVAAPPTVSVSAAAARRDRAKAFGAHRLARTAVALQTLLGPLQTFSASRRTPHSPSHHTPGSARAGSRADMARPATAASSAAARRRASAPGREAPREPRTTAPLAAASRAAAPQRGTWAQARRSVRRAALALLHNERAMFAVQPACDASPPGGAQGCAGRSVSGGSFPDAAPRDRSGGFGAGRGPSGLAAGFGSCGWIETGMDGLCVGAFPAGPIRMRAYLL